MVRSLHYAPYQTARDQLSQRLAKQYKGKTIPSAVSARERGKIYCDHILLGWRGFDEDYSPETAVSLMTNPAYRSLVEDVEWCAAQMSQVDLDLSRRPRETPRRLALAPKKSRQ